MDSSIQLKREIKMLDNFYHCIHQDISKTLIIYNKIYQEIKLHQKDLNNSFLQIFLNYTGIYQPKFLTIKLQFNPQNECLRIITARPRGLHTQQFDINNILPWSYRDMMAMSKWPQFTLPPFLDDQMIYMNKILKQVYIFQSDGVWNQETVKHPKLSLQARLNQGDWFDKWSMV